MKDAAHAVVFAAADDDASRQPHQGLSPATLRLISIHSGSNCCLYTHSSTYIKYLRWPWPFLQCNLLPFCCRWWGVSPTPPAAGSAGAGADHTRIPQHYVPSKGEQSISCLLLANASCLASTHAMNIALTLCRAGIFLKFV